ncbi:hypothetical protein Tco_0865376, partial [Tanacetum coccineum]
MQNAWNILENNGLSECVVKYCGGLSFLFEWKSSDLAMKNLDSNKLWLQQWFEEIKPWEENYDLGGRLAWLYIDGLPFQGTNIGAIKTILKDFGKILKIGKLDFDAKILHPVKSLVLLPNMNEGYVGPTLVVEDDEDGIFSGELKEENKGSGDMPSPCNIGEELGFSFKHGWVRELVDRYSSLFLGIQESKLVSCDSYVVRSLWPHNYVEFAVSDSVGASGGILTMWDSRTFCMEHSF